MTVRTVFLGLLTLSTMAFAQAPDPCATAPASCATLIETHATSQMRIPNTAVDVAVGVSVSGKDLPEVQRAMTDQSNRLLAYLKGEKAERLITTRVSFTPEMRYDKSAPNKIVGYSGTSEVSFRTTPAKAPDILAGVLANGANQIDSTVFTPTEAEIADARRRLSEEATKTAVQQADAIARAAGMKVVAIRNISVDSDNTFRPMPMQVNTFAMKNQAAAPMDTASGDEQLSMRVNLTAAATR